MSLSVDAGRADSATRPAPRRPGPWIRRPAAQHGAVLALFAACSLLIFGRIVGTGFSHRIVATTPQDAAIFIWALRWWPYAVVHHLDPLYSSYVWAPYGMNLSWTTTFPVIGFLFAPITLAFGPIVSFNVLSLLAPAACAFTAYLLCLRVTHSVSASVAGGFLYGFSALEIAQVDIGHPNLYLVFMVPVCAYLVVRFLEGSLGRRAFVGWLAAALVAQFGISTEIFATMTLFGAVAIALGLVVARGHERGRLLSAARLIGCAYLVTLVVVSPYLYGGFALPRPIMAVAGRTTLSAYVRNLGALKGVIVPGTRIVGGNIWPFQTTWLGDTLYLGVPLLLVLIWVLVARWRQSAVRVLAVTFVAVLVCAVGTAVSVHGRLIPLPWRAVQRLPLIRLALPGRLMVFGWLIVGLAVAVWVADADRRRWARWAVVLVVAVTGFSNLSHIPAVAEVPVPAFFDSGQYHRYLSPGETILVVDPFPGWRGREFRGYPMVWQAQSDMGFRLAGGFLGLVKAHEPFLLLHQNFTRLRVNVSDGSRVRSMLRSLGVRAVVATDPPPGVLPKLEGLLGVAPARAGGVWIFRGPFGS